MGYGGRRARRLEDLLGWISHPPIAQEPFEPLPGLRAHQQVQALAGVFRLTMSITVFLLKPTLRAMSR
jgi:hypothetical protein